MFLFLLLSCAPSVLSLYETEKSAALAVVSEVPPNWAPEVRMRLGTKTVDSLVGAALTTALERAESGIELVGPLGVGVRLTPKATLTSLAVRPDDRCGGCLTVEGTLSGTTTWSIGGVGGQVPFDAQVAGRAAFDLSPEGSGWSLTGRILSLDKLVLGGVKAGRIDISQHLQAWAQKSLAQAPAIPLGQLGGEQLPFRAVRLDSSGGALEVQALPAGVSGGPVSASARPLAEGWELRVSQETALAVIRRQAFEEGIGAYDIAVDPRSLAVDGGGFTLGLRIWRLKGRGWWRDYLVTGALAVQGGKARLTPTGAEEGAKSRGAAIADPLALLAEKRILEEVEGGLSQAFPARQAFDLGRTQVKANAEAVEGIDGAVQVTGALVLTTPQQPTSGSSRGGEKKGGEKKGGDKKSGDKKSGDKKSGDKPTPPKR